MKFKKDEIEIELLDPNTFNIAERAGFEPVEEEIDEELKVLREKTKELGIKGYHNMKKETLLAKISEYENK